MIVESDKMDFKTRNGNANICEKFAVLTFYASHCCMSNSRAQYQISNVKIFIFFMFQFPTSAPS